MVDMNEKDDLGRPKWGMRYPHTHKHEWRRMLTSTASEIHWVCGFRENLNMYPCGAMIATRPSDLTSDEAIALLRDKLNGVGQDVVISAEKMAELKTAARNLAENIDKLAPQLKLILLVESL